MTPNEIFVYGTLRPGAAEWASHGYTADPEPATVIGTLIDYGPFPYLRAQGNTVVVGAILHLDDDTARYVRYVEIGAGYKEHAIVATLPDGSTREVMTYVAADRRIDDLQVYPLVTSGDWVEHDARRWAAELADLGPVE